MPGGDAIQPQVRLTTWPPGGDEFVIVVAGDDVPVATMVGRGFASIDAALADRLTGARVAVEGSWPWWARVPRTSRPLIGPYDE